MKNFFSLVLILFHVCCFAQKAVPELWGLHVHDEAHILSQQTVDNLENYLRTYEDSTSNQIAILIVTSLDGDDLESYSLKVAEKWKLGKKEKDNGVLLLIAVDDHKMRIETGQGLQGVLTDAVCSRIIRNEMAPRFRKNNFDEGVSAAINAITKAIGGEYKADDNESAETADLSFTEKLLFGAFIFGVLGIFATVALFAKGKAGWAIYAFLIPFYAIFPMAVLGFTVGVIALAIYLIGFPVLRMLVARSTWGKRIIDKMQTSRSSSSSGGIWMGSDWSSGSDSSSGSGSDFSGGGGSFDGGGSSGSW